MTRNIKYESKIILFYGTRWTSLHSARSVFHFSPSSSSSFPHLFTQPLFISLRMNFFSVSIFRLQNNSNEKMCCIRLVVVDSTHRHTGSPNVYNSNNNAPHLFVAMDGIVNYYFSDFRSDFGSFMPCDFFSTYFRLVFFSLIPILVIVTHQ